MLVSSNATESDIHSFEGPKAYQTSQIAQLEVAHVPQSQLLERGRSRQRPEIVQSFRGLDVDATQLDIAT